jgi:Zn-dependent protease with chaperone function
MPDAPKADSPPPSLAAAEAEFVRGDRIARRTLRVAAMATLAIVLGACLLPAGPVQKTLATGLIIGSVIWALTVVDLLTLRLRSRPLTRMARRTPDATFGHVSASQLAAMVEDAGREFEGREQPAVYVLRAQAANACAINARYLDILAPFNAVYITTGLLARLDREEVRAVLLHELAHFHRYIYADYTTKLALQMVLGTAIATGWRCLQTYGNAAGVIAFVAIIAPIGMGLSARVDRHIEFLCDHFAARRAGLLPMVNALVVLGRANRSWAATKGLSRMIARKLKGRSRLDWAAVDSLVPNGRIEPDEYPRLIALLRERRDAVLVDDMIDVESDSHPSLARRILFLDAAGAP